MPWVHQVKTSNKGYSKSLKYDCSPGTEKKLLSMMKEELKVKNSFNNTGIVLQRLRKLYTV